MGADTQDFDVAVVGGGAAGYASALTAASCGLRTILFAPPAHFPPGRTAALLQGSVDLLSELGVWPTLAERAAPLKAIRLVDATQRLIRAPETTFFASEIGLSAFGYNVPNGELVEALRGRAETSAGLTIDDAPVRGVTTGDRHVSIQTDSATATARLAVAADGARSITREAAGIAVRTWPYSQAALVATFAIEYPHGGISTEFHTSTGPFTLVPLPGRRVSLVWVDNAAVAERTIALDDDVLARIAEARAHFVHGAMRLDSRPALVPLSAALAERFAARRIVLVGEAAHLFPPIGAQGLNLGFRDVEALKRVLTRHHHDPGSEAALLSFHAMRRTDIRTRTYAVDLLNRSLLTAFLPAQAGRALGLGLAGSVPPLRRFLMRRGLAGAAAWRT